MVAAQFRSRAVSSLGRSADALAKGWLWKPVIRLLCCVVLCCIEQHRHREKLSAQKLVRVTRLFATAPPLASVTRAEAEAEAKAGGAEAADAATAPRGRHAGPSLGRQRESPAVPAGGSRQDD